MGFPTIAVRIPSSSILPSSRKRSNCSMTERICSTSFKHFSEKPSREMCSGSSSAASIKAVSSKRTLRHAVILSFNAPCTRDREARAPASVLEEISSATASAWERSILPFKKALFVNSPGSAALAPFCSVR